MGVISIISLIILAFVIVSVSKKTKQEKIQGETNGNWRKIGLSLLLFVPFFVGFYMLVAMLICIPLGITMAAGEGGWAYGIMGGFALSPVLTVLTIYLVVWRK